MRPLGGAASARGAREAVLDVTNIDDSGLGYLSAPVPASGVRSDGVLAFAWFLWL